MSPTTIALSITVGVLVLVGGTQAAQPPGQTSSSAPAPRLVPFQGHLTRPSAADPRRYEAVPDGRYDVLFTLYTAPVGGDSRVWGPERHEKLVVFNGLVNALIGSVDGGLEKLGHDVMAGPIYVGITIDADGKPETPDLELVPRQVLLPALYSHRAGYAQDSEQLAGRDGATVLAELKQVQEALAQVRNTLAVNTPAGAILPFAGSEAPQGWLLCNGEFLDAEKNPRHRALAEILGTTYDPDHKGVRLPDLRGRSLMGSGQGNQLTVRELGSYLGVEQQVLTLEQMPRHKHEGVTKGGNASAYRVVGTAVGLTLAPNHVTGWSPGVQFKELNDNKYSMSQHTHNFETDEQGNSTPVGMIGPSLCVNYIIKY